ncbi:hypothetical protein [Actinoplanes sp. NPDC020271]|uniref:hypothetical protein n=1 Tax=Actinoplanes sp. NPDC020271 TaxID=3363896 RepID=UPI0037B4ADE9
MPTLEARVTRLEARMDEQEHLRVIHDQELSNIFLKLQAQDSLLQAIHLNQADQTATLAKHTAMHDDHTARLTRLEVDLGLVKTDLGLVKTGMERIAGMLDTLIERGSRQ